MHLVFIVPVYGQGALLGESVGALLRQRTDLTYHAILVDDACPQPETVATARRFARAYPDRVSYWRSPQNGGLAAMRNRGIELALQRWPDLFALVSYDGDDRLHPEFVERSVAALRRHRETDKTGRIGWVFEDPDQFGNHGMMERVHRYSALWSLVGCANCPTSICHGDMFRQGLRFREDMKHGSEDWQFWLACLEAGFRGAYEPHLGFRYRRRAGSMTVSAQAQADANRTSIRHSLPDLFTPASFLREEAAEMPRYAVIDDTGTLRLRANAADAGRAITVEAYAQMLADYARLPTAPVPQYLVALPRQVEAGLAKAKLLDWALWQAEADAGADKIAMMRLRASADGSGIHNRALAGLGRAGQSQLICLSSDLVARRARGLALGAGGDGPGASVDRLVELPAAAGDLAAPALQTVLQAVIAHPGIAEPAKRADFTQWRPFGLRYYDLSRDLLDITCLMPRPEFEDQMLVVADAQQIERQDGPAALNALAEDIVARGWPAPSLLVVGFRVDSRAIQGFDRVFLHRGPDGAGKAGAPPLDPLMLGLIAPFGTILTFGSARVIPELNMVRRWQRRILGALPPGDSSLSEELINCFKVFSALLCPDAAAAARAQGLGLAPEQIARKVPLSLAG
ncbi:MAG: glycosyltransferase family A protein [Pseudomonadota bacterium]